MNNAKVLITARLKSSRLKSKALLPIGKTKLIIFLIKRLQLVFKKNNIVLITSKKKQDKKLVSIAKKEGINFFRGDPNDVMIRMSLAAKKFNAKNFISCTADNPFTDPFYAKKLYNFHINNRFHMSTIKKLPFGTFTYAVNTKALNKLISMKNTSDTEVWGNYFRKINQFRCGIYKKIPKFLSKPKIRLTIDYIEDYNFITKLYKLSKKKMPSLSDLLKCLEKNPHLLQINKKIKQKKSSPIKIKKQFKKFIVKNN